MRGVEHRQIQQCARCGGLVAWTPAAGWCPYCDLTSEQRHKSMDGPRLTPEPCPPDCCKEGTT